MNFDVYVDEDPVVTAVMRRYFRRSMEGMKKYGKPMTRNDLDIMDWIQHLQEELMDATLYLERLKREVE